jgi:hypothetical protein
MRNVGDGDHRTLLQVAKPELELLIEDGAAGDR